MSDSLGGVAQGRVCARIHRLGIAGGLLLVAGTTLAASNNVMSGPNTLSGQRTAGAQNTMSDQGPSGPQNGAHGTAATVNDNTQSGQATNARTGTKNRQNATGDTGAMTSGNAASGHAAMKNQNASGTQSAMRAQGSPSGDNHTMSGQNAAGGGGAPSPSQPQSPDAKAIASRLQDMNADNAPQSAIQAFYKARQDRPAWFNTQGQPTPAAGALIHYIHGVSRQGLSPSAYLQGPLSNAVPNVSAHNPDQLATADLAMSRTFATLAHDLHDGVVDNPSIRVTWRQPKAPVDYQQILANATGGHPARVLNGLAPQQSQYAALRKALAYYRQIADNGGWPTIGSGKVLKKGKSDPRIATLWKRLQMTGDAPGNQAAPKTYNDVVMTAVRHYQKRNGLKTDGLLGPHTRASLNVPATKRADEIALNMERWRWMPASFGPRYIAVNVPDYHLRAVDKNGRSIGMNVIVGESYHGKQTPMFSDNMQYLVFRPFWNVPPNIANRDIVPKARSNADYLSDHHFQIVKRFTPSATPLALDSQNIDKVADGSLLVRQKGGPYNALGLVKFIFPNKHSVYLHSTSAKQLFNRHTRDLSHGCVRVANPVALAAFVLQGKSGWGKARIEKAMHTGGRKKIPLANPIPVYMLYWTAFVGPNGTMNFRKDLYGHDKTLENALKNDAQMTL